MRHLLINTDLFVHIVYSYIYHQNIFSTYDLYVDICSSKSD